MNILFSILLPTYKRWYLKECIDSILGQTYPNWELIIVNDASPEDIDSVIESYTDSRIQYYKNEHNFGAKRLVEQWNYCLSLAKGEYVLCIGDDDRLMPNCLEQYAQLITENPHIELLHGQTDIINEYGIIEQHLVPRPKWESAMSLMYHRVFEHRAQFIGDFCFQRKALLAKGGFYNLQYAWGSDDISALQTAEVHGVLNTKEVVFNYRNHAGSITSHAHVFGKIKAILQEARWYRKFLQHPTNNAQDELYRAKLKRNLLIHTLRKCYYVILNAYSATNK